MRSGRMNSRTLAAFSFHGMLGNGGNKVPVFPGLDMAAVLTSTNYNNRGAHQQTDRLLSDYILTAVT
jgi:hypothetical protein